MSYDAKTLPGKSIRRGMKVGDREIIEARNGAGSARSWTYLRFETADSNGSFDMRVRRWGKGIEVLVPVPAAAVVHFYHWDSCENLCGEGDTMTSEWENTEPVTCPVCRLELAKLADENRVGEVVATESVIEEAYAEDRARTPDVPVMVAPEVGMLVVFRADFSADLLRIVFEIEDLPRFAAEGYWYVGLKTKYRGRWARRMARVDDLRTREGAHLTAGPATELAATLDRHIVTAPIADARAVTAALESSDAVTILIPSQVDRTLREIAERNDVPVALVRDLYAEQIGDSPVAEIIGEEGPRGDDPETGETFRLPPV